MAQVQVYSLLAPIAQVCRGCNNTTMIDAYVRAVRKLCNRSRWWQSSLIGATEADEPAYNLGSDTYSEIVGVSAASVLIATDDTRNLTERNSTLWDADEDAAAPEFYQYVPHGQIALHPTPDAAYTMTVGLILQPKINSNSIDDSLLVKWSDDFIHGALAYLLALPGLPWTDLRKAAVQDDLFMRAINSAASDVQAGYNAGATPSGEVGARTANVRTGYQAL